MRVPVTHDRALVDHGQRGLEAGHWPISYPLGSELALALVRTLATTVQHSIRRWSSQFRGTGIHVSRMSSTWLRMHEAEDDRHRGEV
jgi:hypothetical protein